MRPILVLALFSCCGCGNGVGSDAAAPADLATGDRTLGEAGAPPDQATLGDLATAVDLAGPADLTAAPDLATAPDLAMGGCVMHPLLGADCTTLVAYTNEWLDCHKGCSSNMECVSISAHRNTGCKNPCPGVANANADGAYLQSLNSAFNSAKCGHAGCDCINIGVPTCKQQVCTSM